MLLAGWLAGQENSTTPSTGLTATFTGGDQEGGIRPGTLNVPGIVGMGEACRLAKVELASVEPSYLSGLRDHFEDLVMQFAPGAVINGCKSCRLPGTTNIALPGIPADVLIANVPSVCFSSGSACTSGSPTPSHVLLAMGRSREQANHAVRFAVGRYNSRQEIEDAARLIREVVESYPGGMS
jgi:cysteine desulfurase